MKLTFSSIAWENYLYWQKTDKKILKRINILIKDIQRSPYEGIGKPEPLKHGLAGYWSRRLMMNKESFTNTKMTRFLLHNSDIIIHNAMLIFDYYIEK